MDHYHPYKTQILQEPSNRDFVSRSAFCEQFVSLVKKKKNDIQMFVGVPFELFSCVNKQN
jgi:hypothetical protein